MFTNHEVLKVHAFDQQLSIYWLIPQINLVTLAVIKSCHGKFIGGGIQIQVFTYTEILTVLAHLWRGDRLSLNTHN